MIIRERSIPGRPFVRHVRLSWPITVLVLVAGLAGLWLSAGPAYAQEGEPPPRVITRPDRASPSPQMIADELAAQASLSAVEDRGQSPTRLQSLSQFFAMLGRPWVQSAPNWPALPQVGIVGKEDRFVPAGPSAPLAGTFTVNSTADTNLLDSVLTLREALLVANGSLTGPFSPAEQAQLSGCSFDSSGVITGGCGANIQDTIFFAPALGFRPVITVSSSLPMIADSRPTLLLGAFLFNNVQPVINMMGHPGLRVDSDGNTIAAVSVISAAGSGIRIDGNQNVIGYWATSRRNGGAGIYVNGLTNTIEGAYIGVFSNTLTNNFDCDGNGAQGVFVSPTARATTIRNSIIGCNGASGVMLSGSDNLIGGPDFSTSGNTIAQNGAAGIYVLNSLRNRIQANVIGLNETGILIAGGRQNTITAGLNPISDTNAILYNTLDGIRFEGGAKENLVANGQIYLNGRHGVNLIGSGTATNTLTRTLVAINIGDGIRQDSSAGPNLWREMAIANNGGLGIDINADDHTSNIPNPPYVFITSVNKMTGLVQGKANGSQPLVFILTYVDLYRIALDPSGFGEGHEFVGSASTDSSGNWSITDPNPSLSNGCYTAVVRGLAIVVPYATEFSLSNCSAFVPIARRP